MDSYIDYHPSYDGIRGWLMGLALLVILIPLALIFVYADESWKVLGSPERLEALAQEIMCQFQSLD